MIVEDIHLIGEAANAAPSQEITTGYRSRCSDCVDLMNCLAFWYVRASSLFMPLSYLIWLPWQAGPVGYGLSCQQPDGPLQYQHVWLTLEHDCWSEPGDQLLVARFKNSSLLCLVLVLVLSLTKVSVRAGQLIRLLISTDFDDQQL